MKRTLPVYLLFFTVLLLGACGRWQVTSVQSHYYTLDTLAADSGIHTMIAPYKARVDSIMNEELAELPFDLIKGKPNGNLGFWMADALRNQASIRSGSDIDLAVINQGGIRRAYLNKGPVTLGMIYELMPFDNFVVVLQADGELVYRILKVACERGGDPISGAQVRVRKDTLEIHINGQPLLMDKTYLLATNDYMYEGGDGYGLMQEATRVERYALVRHCLMDEMKSPFKKPFPDAEERRIIHD